MRPRHEAADNVLHAVFDVVADIASMRPRHEAADNRFELERLTYSPGASMRPRHEAADNLAMLSLAVLLELLQ